MKQTFIAGFMALAACRGEEPADAPTASGPIIQAETSVSKQVPRRIQTSVRLTKPGDPGAVYSLLDHPFRVRVYRSADYADAPLWDSARWRAVHARSGRNHPSDEFAFDIRVSDLLGDSLPPGQYHVTVSMLPHPRLNGDTTEVPAGVIDLGTEPPHRPLVPEVTHPPIRTDRLFYALTRAGFVQASGYLASTRLVATYMNRTADTVFLARCGRTPPRYHFERWVEGEWRSFFGLLACPAHGGPPIPIAPGESRVDTLELHFEVSPRRSPRTDTAQLSGTYRVVYSLLKNGSREDGTYARGDLVPKEDRVSNTFRIRH